MLKNVLAAAAAALALISAGPASAQTALKWAHTYEPTEPFHTEALWAAEEIKKRTNGRYAITVYPASQLGKEGEINQGLSLGTVDMIISGSSWQAKEYKPIGVTYYPYIFRDIPHLLAYAKSDVFKKLAAGYEKETGNHILALTYFGTRQTTTSSRVVKTCADLKGLKMRVPDAPAYLAMPRACGANTSPIAFAEVYLALQNGTVEGQENPVTAIDAKKFYEVQKNIILTGHITDHLNTVISGDRWGALSEEDKKVFADVAQEASERMTKIVQDREAKLLGVFKERGLNVVDVDKADFEKTVLEKAPLETYGYRREDWEAIRAIK